MRRKLLVLACCALFLAVPSLAQESMPQSKDEAALRAADAQWEKAAAARDLSRTVDFYANDAVMMEPSAPAFVGKAAIRAQWQKEMSDKAYTLKWSATAAGGSGDLGYTRGRYEASYTNEKGVPVTEKGKYLVLWKKVGNDWNVDTEIYNADAPPSPRSDARSGKQ